jgi:hypothetical protein
MAEQTVYLVSSGVHGDYHVEAIMGTAELAEGLRVKVADANMVRPMPVLDYVPEQTTVWTHALRLDPETGWGWCTSADDGGAYSTACWDFEVPAGAPTIEYDAETSAGMVIRISHTDQETARRTAEALLAALRGGR